MKDLQELIESLPTISVLVVGDIILDTFVYGSVSRISPEGPVPVLAVTRENKMLGGAGNVFSNLMELRVKTQLLSVIGDDAEGQKIAGIVQDRGGDNQYLIKDPQRPTILKTRYQARSQQLLRVDIENVFPVSDSIKDSILKQAYSLIPTVQALILSDYGKGMLTPDVLKGLIECAAQHGIPVIVDPKGRDYSLYAGASVVTPNRTELSEAAQGMPTKTDGEVSDAARYIIQQSKVKSVLATRSEDGMTLIEGNQEQPFHLTTKALEVFDVSGAGDTVVATVAAVLAAGGSLRQAAVLANMAGGIVVAKIGTATVQPRELIEEIKQQSSHDFLNQGSAKSFIAKILEIDEAIQQVRLWQEQGLKVGFTNGCFDILHYGHVNYLNQARSRCDRLIVGLNHDCSVRILKGPERPINDQIARATVIGGLGAVDLVVFFGAEKTGEDNTPCEIVGKLKPDILMKGGDYKIEDLPEAKIALSYGGMVDIMPLYEGYSTTQTISKMKKIGA